VLQATISPPSNLNTIYSLVDELIKKKEFLNIIRIGRGYLKLQEFAKSLQFFEYVESKIDKTDYQNKNYGGLHDDIYSVCYNPIDNRAVYSFPVSKSLAV